MYHRRFASISVKVFESISDKRSLLIMGSSNIMGCFTIKKVGKLCSKWCLMQDQGPMLSTFMEVNL
jgi:hypothetical protein